MIRIQIGRAMWMKKLLEPDQSSAKVKPPSLLTRATWAGAKSNAWRHKEKTPPNLHNEQGRTGMVPGSVQIGGWLAQFATYTWLYGRKHNSSRTRLSARI
jgi:hypothetical protein